MTDEAPNYSGEDLQRLGAKWMERIRAAEKRESRWMEDAEKAETAYLCDEEGEGAVPDFNILHSNVETIVPAIYNSTPAPDIRPRHNAGDPVAKMASDIFERAIASQIDDSRLDAEIESGAHDAFLAGRGVVRVRFDADEEGEVLTNERLLYENVSWRDYREGQAKRWGQVPWVAFRHVITQEELDRISDDELLDAQKQPDEVTPDEDADVTVWEVWCKDTRTVKFVAEDNNKVLRMEDDPLGLRGFFPMPPPVQPIGATGKRTPVCPYKVYKTLAEELDRYTRRINAITKGLKVRGLVVGNMQDLERLSEAEDNQLIPVEDTGSIAAVGDLNKAIVWWPLEQAITVLRELYQLREGSKQAIYEITGISDIVRGASKSGETATAQQIKTQWGSLRIKRMQRLIERQVRDIFVISAEIMARHFSPETLQRMAGIMVPPEMADQVLPMLSKPLDHYRIDVESDSTVRADLTAKRSEMSEFLNGTAQFFSTVAPIVQRTPEAAGPMTDIFAAFARQFSLGKQAEDAVEQMADQAKQMAQQPQPNPEAEARQAEQQMKAQEFQAEQQFKAQEFRAEIQMRQDEMALKREEAALEGQHKQAELALKERELALKEQELSLKRAEAGFKMEGEARKSELDRLRFAGGV